MRSEHPFNLKSISKSIIKIFFKGGEGVGVSKLNKERENL